MLGVERSAFAFSLLIDRHVLVVLLQRLSVFGDLNGFRIEDPNRHVLTAKFNRTISRRDPSFERCFCLIAERYPHVSSFERLDGDSILFGLIPVEANWLLRAACDSSSLVTGFALRTSGSAGAVESAAKALRVSGGPTCRDKATRPAHS